MDGNPSSKHLSFITGSFFFHFQKELKIELKKAYNLMLQYFRTKSFAYFGKITSKMRFYLTIIKTFHAFN